MLKRVSLFLVVFLFSSILIAQQNFSLSKYFVANPEVGAAVRFNQPNDMMKVENYVKNLIETGDFSFPDIYGSNLTPDPSQWASYPDSVLWNVYYAYMAFSIYIDFSNKVPWRLSDLTTDQLDKFFYTEYFFNLYHKNFGPSSTPTNPLFTYSFLIENNLIGKTRKETIERLIQWSRYRLGHFTGLTTSENLYNHWQYNDGPPVERVITGTTYTTEGRFMHWSRGCPGATYFFRNVLQIINIPVVPNFIGSHFAMNFPSEQVIMLHGDDIYGIIDEMNDVEIPPGEILIHYEEVDSIIAKGFTGNEIVGYGSGKAIANYFPLRYYHPTDTSRMYSNYSNALLSYTRSDTTAQYYDIMNQARVRYSAVDIDRYNEISNHYWNDSLWYKKVYGLNSMANIDTVLILHNKGYADIINDTVFIYTDESTTEITPIFFRSADSYINIQADSIINFSSPAVVTVTAEDSLLNISYPIVRNVLTHYSISISANIEEAGEFFGEGIYPHGTNVSILAAPSKGFYFVNWTEADTVVSESKVFSFEVLEDRHFIAHFDTIEYTISVTVNPEVGGTIDGVGIYLHGSMVELIAIPADHYHFLGWMESNYYFNHEPSISFVAEQERELIAEFALNSYWVGVYPNPEEGGAAEGTGLYLYGTAATVAAIPSDEFVFVNWKNGQEIVSTNLEYSFIVDGPVVLIANFAIECNISIKADPEEGGVVTGTGIYLSGNLATISATPNVGYRLVNITDNDNPAWMYWWPNYTFIVDQPKDFTANFEKLKFTIEGIPNSWSAGYITGNGVYEYGDEVELTAIAEEGFVFVNWTEDGLEVSAESTYIFTAEKHRSLIANFSVITAIDLINDNNYSIVFFPNPVKEVLFIQIIEINEYVSTNLSFSLINSSGNIIKLNSKNSSDGLVEIAVSDVPAGFYIIDLGVNNNSIGQGRILIVK